MTAGLPDGSTMDSSHVATLRIPGLRKKARQVHIFSKIKIAPLISLELLYTLDNQYMPV